MNSAPAAAGPGNTWLIFALLTVLSWGVYGVILHKGRGYMPMGSETPHAGLKAFLFVCIAYAIIGVASAVLLKVRGSDWSLTPMGIQWSLIAGAAGAVGAFTLVLALGAAAPIYKGAAAAAVMPIVFGGAPVINTLVAMLLHPPQGGISPSRCRSSWAASWRRPVPSWWPSTRRRTRAVRPSRRPGLLFRPFLPAVRRTLTEPSSPSAPPVTEKPSA